ncbi:MAG: hypothetical protein ACREOE_12400 [Gemmatimonadales bacterium]
MRLFVGDDWAEDHHDVEVMDAAGLVPAKARLPEGVAGGWARGRRAALADGPGTGRCCRTPGPRRPGCCGPTGTR